MSPLPFLEGCGLLYWYQPSASSSFVQLAHTKKYAIIKAYWLVEIPPNQQGLRTPPAWLNRRTAGQPARDARDAMRSTTSPAKRILVVDDEPGMREFLAFALGLKGYQVRTAAGGPEAIENVRSEECDLVFLDVRMPEMDGVEVLRILREVRSDLPVVMMTGYAVEQRLQEALKEGARGCLRKPFTLDELLSCIRGALATASA